MNPLTRLRLEARHAYYGWWIVAGAIGLQVLAAGLVMQAYGTYVAVWQAEFGWSKTAFAVAFALQRGQMAVLSPVQGWLLKRFGPRTVIQVGVVVLAMGFLLLSRFDSLVGFYLSFLVMALGVGLSGFLSLTTTIVNWFERRRSSALALMQVGISLGGLAVPIVAWLLTTQGWRATAVISAVVVLVAGIPLSLLMRSTPEAYGMRLDGDAPEPEVPGGDAPEGRDGRRGAAEREAPAGREPRSGRHARATAAPRASGDFRAREALRTRAFWFITFGHALAVTLVASVSVHLVVHLNEGLGFSIQTAATVVAVMTAATMAGQIAGGVLGDRFDKRLIATLAMFGHGTALVVLAHAPSMAWVLVFALVHGVAWGMRGPVMQALRADYFGRASFPTIMGISFSFVMLGQMAGPLLAGIMADALGDYRLAFTVLAAMVTIGSGFFVFARPPRRPTAPPA